jgi:Flp pilus assembly protein TadD
MYVFENQPGKAVPLFEKSIWEYKDDAEAQYSYGKALKLTGHLTEAESALRKAIQLDNKQANAHALLSGILKEQGQTGEARKESDLANSLKTGESSAPKR